MSKARDLSDFISVATVDASEIADLAITHAKLHTDMNLSSKTVTLPSAITNTITNKLPLAGGTLTGNITIDSSASASLTLDRVSTNAGSTLDFKTAGALKWYMGLRGLSNDSFYIRDEVGNTDALTITSGGNIGIGTTSPQEKLEVNGVLQIRRDGDHPAMRFAEINSGTTTARGYIASGDWAVNGGAIDDFGISGSATGDLLLATNAGVERLRIQNSTGNVGIGANLPYTLLELSSTDPILRFNDSNGGTDTKNFELRYVGTNSPDIDGLYFRTVNDANSVYSDKMVILGSGNVGIGTNSPSSKLEVLNTYASDSTEQVRFRDNTGGSLDFYGYANATKAIQALDSSDNDNPKNLMLNPSGGNVGIGTANPGQKLTVAGAVESTSAQGSVNFYATTAGSYSQLNGSGGTAWAYGSTGGNSAPNTAASSTFGFHHWNGSAWSNPLNLMTNGVTMPDRLQPNVYWPIIHNAAITGTFNASGAGINAWHAITNFNFNNAGNSQADGGRGHNFMIYWQSGNVSRGYNHRVTGHVPYMGANSYISYQGNSYLTSGMDSSHPWTGLINVSHHTAPTSGHDIRVRVFGDGVSYGQLQLQIWAEATPNAANAKISIWRV